MLITSRANANVKRIRRLFNRRERQRTGLFFAEGVRLVAEAIEMRADIQELILAPELLSKHAAEEVAIIQARTDIPLLQVTPEVFKSISPKDGQDGAAVVARQRWEDIEDLRLSSEICWVALHQIQHPGSLGTILRVCDAVGGAGLLLMGDSTDPYDPTAVRTSLGAIFSQRLVKTTFSEFAAWKRRHQYFVVGTSPTASTDYQAVCYQPPVVLLMGAERIGLSPEQQAVCDLMVRIPMVGRCESHHVGVATGIVLYEIFNQRRTVEQ